MSNLLGLFSNDNSSPLKSFLSSLLEQSNQDLQETLKTNINKETQEWSSKLLADSLRVPQEQEETEKRSRDQSALSKQELSDIVDRLTTNQQSLEQKVAHFLDFDPQTFMDYHLQNPQPIKEAPKFFIPFLKGFSDQATLLPVFNGLDYKKTTMIKEFVATYAPEKTFQQIRDFLEMNKWNIEVAVNAYYDGSCSLPDPKKEEPNPQQIPNYFQELYPSSSPQPPKSPFTFSNQIKSEAPFSGCIFGPSSQNFTFPFLNQIQSASSQNCNVSPMQRRTQLNRVRNNLRECELEIKKTINILKTKKGDKKPLLDDEQLEIDEDVVIEVEISPLGKGKKKELIVDRFAAKANEDFYAPASFLSSSPSALPSTSKPSNWPAVSQEFGKGSIFLKRNHENNKNDSETNQFFEIQDVFETLKLSFGEFGHILRAETQNIKQRTQNYINERETLMLECEKLTKKQADLATRIKQLTKQIETLSQGEKTSFRNVINSAKDPKHLRFLEINVMEIICSLDKEISRLEGTMPIFSSNHQPEDVVCCVCHENKPNVFYTKCGHTIVCSTCDKELKVCPYCRETITSRQKAYLP